MLCADRVPTESTQFRVRLTLIAGADLAKGGQSRVAVARRSDVTEEIDFDLGRKRNIGDLFLRLAALPTFPLDRLSRYEYLLWRQARQLVFTLESLRRRKRQPSRSSFPFSFRRVSSMRL